MKRLIVMYPYKTKLLCMTGNHLYSFGIRASFWSRLAEVPNLAIERIVEEAKKLTENFALHEPTKKKSYDEEDETIILILVPLPFCISILKELLVSEEVLPSNIYVIPPVAGAVSYYATKKYREEETTLLIHSENRITSFVVLKDRMPIQFKIVNKDLSHRTLRLLEPHLKSGETVYVFSGEENQLVANAVRNPREVLELNEEDILKGVYLSMSSPLLFGNNKGAIKEGTENKSVSVDMGDEE